MKFKVTATIPIELEIDCQSKEEALDTATTILQEQRDDGDYASIVADCIESALVSGSITMTAVDNHYVGLDTAEESIRRIRNRVERGGHDIPVKDVEARFSHRFEDVLKVLPYCDEAKFFDNDNGFVLVAEYRNGQILPFGTYRPAWLSQLLIQST